MTERNFDFPAVLKGSGKIAIIIIGCGAPEIGLSTALEILKAKNFDLILFSEPLDGTIFLESKKEIVPLHFPVEIIQANKNLENNLHQKDIIEMILSIRSHDPIDIISVLKIQTGALSLVGKNFLLPSDTVKKVRKKLFVDRTIIRIRSPG